MEQRIFPHLWFDREAKEAALFYTGLFDDSKVLGVETIEDTPSGDAESVSFELAGQPFMAISAGPYFQFNPSVSLMVACDSVAEVNEKWKALSEGGTKLMPLGEYPFCKWYGWIQDRYGLSWQLMFTGARQTAQKITPSLLFSNEVCGKAEEAVKFYTSIFDGSETGILSRYHEGEAKTPKAKINYASFKLEGMSFSAMDNGVDVDYSFNEAFSFIIKCEDQKEIDYYWDKLSAVPEAEQCGWLKDQFGVSWQVVPEIMDEIMGSEDSETVRRVTEAFLKMKKFDLEILKKAYDGI